jgi:hypothetical protein
MGDQRVLDGERARRTPAPAPAPAAPVAEFQVGPADDHYEREADATAARVVARLTAEGGSGGSGAASAPSGAVQRSAVTVGAEGGPVGGDTADRIASERGGGSALPGEVRSSMEGAFGGADFGGVRLHEGSEAGALNQSLGARAFTVGKDIFLGSSAPALDTPDGQHLLAHELTHTQQQGGSARRMVIRRDLTTLPSLVGSDISTAVGDKDSELDKGVNGMEGAKGGTGSFGEFDSANSFRTDITTARGRDESTATGKWGDKSSQGGISITGNVMSTFDLALDVSKTVQMFMNKDASDADKAGAVMGALASTGKTASSMSGIAKTAQDAQKGSVTDSANSVLGEIAGILTVLSSGYTLVKTIVELISKAGDLTDNEKATKSMEAIKAALDTGKGIIETINKFMSHLGSLATGLVTAVPAIGIAISCVELIMNGINMGYAYVAWAEMREDKRSFKSKATDKDAGKTFWGGNKSYKAIAASNIAEGDKAKAEHEAAIKALADAETAHSGNADKVTQLETTIKDLKAQRKLETNKRAQQSLDRRIIKATADLKQAKDAATGSDTTRTTAQSTRDTKKGAFDAISEKYENSKEYMVSKNLQEIAAKRIQRGALNIGLTLPSIAGDIAILSGAGAAVGGGLKAASGGGKLLAVGIRMGKQAYHNAKGDSKSEENKLKMYDGVIKAIIGHTIKANEAADPAIKATLAAKAIREIQASGMALSTMEAKKGDGQALYSAWLSALKKR